MHKLHQSDLLTVKLDICSVDVFTSSSKCALTRGVLERKAKFLEGKLTSS
jgi:hypothetical protein